jgi:hypothetical protein
VSVSFALTFDYLCPFARNANEHVVAALETGADWDVTFTPYSLSQGHVEEGGVDVWDRDDPSAASGILALEVGLAVRDEFPDRFLAVHRALFAARHDEGRDIKDEAVLRDALAAAGADADAVFDVVRGGEPLKRLRAEHEENVEQHGVWGVPTFIGTDRAVFVRVLDRPEADASGSQDKVEQVVRLVDGHPWLHEFKQSTLEV